MSARIRSPRVTGTSTGLIEVMCTLYVILDHMDYRGAT